MIDIQSAWKGLEEIIPDIMQRFNVGKQRCIEFGVEFGYSTVVFSNYFQEVLGIDTFEGDDHTQHRGNHFAETSDALSGFPAIQLHRSTYQDWIKTDTGTYDLAHVDIIHTYKHTYECGLWAVNHSRCAIFHDTESFLDVRRAVIDLAKTTGKQLYNYPHHFGLGIIA